MVVCQQEAPAAAQHVVPVLGTRTLLFSLLCCSQLVFQRQFLSVGLTASFPDNLGLLTLAKTRCLLAQGLSEKQRERGWRVGSGCRLRHGAAQPVPVPRCISSAASTPVFHFASHLHPLPGHLWMKVASKLLPLGDQHCPMLVGVSTCSLPCAGRAGGSILSWQVPTAAQSSHPQSSLGRFSWCRRAADPAPHGFSLE